MSLNVPPALRAQADQELAEYTGIVDGLLKTQLMTDPMDRVSRVATLSYAIASGLTGVGDERLMKAAAIAAVAIERLARLEEAKPE